MRFRSRAAMALFVWFARPIAAADVIGPVHPVIEPDLIVWLQERVAAQLADGGLERLEAERREATRRYAERPPGARLPRTSEPATRWFDPSITVPYDLRDQEGRLIHAAGTIINPLEWRALSRQLLFFDADDPDQVAWAEALMAGEEWRGKPILVSGAPLELMRRWKQHLSFDQKGLLAEKLGIRQVPALVRQEGDRLRIDEVVVP